MKGWDGWSKGKGKGQDGKGWNRRVDNNMETFQCSRKDILPGSVRKAQEKDAREHGMGNHGLQPDNTGVSKQGREETKAKETKKLGNGFSGMISLEMVGYRDSRPGAQSYPVYVDPTHYPETGDFIAVVGNEPSAKLTHLVAEGMRDAEPALPIEQLIVPGRGDEFTEVRLSDHSPLWEHDIPAVMLTDTAFFRNPNYHQASDTLDTLDLDFIRDTTEAVVGFLKRHLT